MTTALPVTRKSSRSSKPPPELNGAQDGLAALTQPQLQPDPDDAPSQSQPALKRTQAIPVGPDLVTPQRSKQGAPKIRVQPLLPPSELLDPDQWMFVASFFLVAAACVGFMLYRWYARPRGNLGRRCDALWRTVSGVLWRSFVACMHLVFSIPREVARLDLFEMLYQLVLPAISVVRYLGVRHGWYRAREWLENWWSDPWFCCYYYCGCCRRTYANVYMWYTFSDLPPLEPDSDATSEELISTESRKPEAQLGGGSKTTLRRRKRRGHSSSSHADEPPVQSNGISSHTPTGNGLPGGSDSANKHAHAHFDEESEEADRLALVSASLSEPLPAYWLVAHPALGVVPADAVPQLLQAAEDAVETLAPAASSAAAAAARSSSAASVAHSASSPSIGGAASPKLTGASLSLPHNGVASPIGGASSPKRVADVSLSLPPPNGAARSLQSCDPG